MDRYVYTSRPAWVKEGADVTIETAMAVDEKDRELRAPHVSDSCNAKPQVSCSGKSMDSCSGQSQVSCSNGSDSIGKK